MPAETLHVSICLRHELEGGDSPSAAASTSHAGPWPLCWRQWQSRTVPSPCLQELPGPIRLVPAPPCPALGCRTYSCCPGEREQLKPTHWAQFFNGFKRKKKKKRRSKTKPAAASPAPSCHGGRWEGASPRLYPLLGLVARETRETAPGPLPATSITSAPSSLSYNF